jgi:hypothetical protein
MSEDELWAEVFAEAEKQFGKPLEDGVRRALRYECAEWVAAHRLPEWAYVLPARIPAGE